MVSVNLMAGTASGTTPFSATSAKPQQNSQSTNTYTRAGSPMRKPSPLFSAIPQHSSSSSSSSACVHSFQTFISIPSFTSLRFWGFHGSDDLQCGLLDYDTVSHTHTHTLKMEAGGTSENYQNTWWHTPLDHNMNLFPLSCLSKFCTNFISTILFFGYSVETFGLYFLMTKLCLSCIRGI